MHSINAVAAVIDPDPYPYYQRLLAGPPLYFDAGLRLWVASRAAVIQEVLENPLCAVRPTAEPVPKAIAGSSAGTVFSRLIRMNDGAGHASARRVIAAALAALDQATITASTAQFASALQRRHGLAEGAAVTAWIFDLPTYVVAGLLGFGSAELPQVALWTTAFVRCLSPLSSSEQLADASTAAHALQERLAQMLQDATGMPGGLLPNVVGRAAEAGWADQAAIVANLIGLLSQTHEATAGLIGNSVVALLRQPQWQARLRDDPTLAAAFVLEVARFDPPVQNTRRFVTHPTRVAGVALEPGDTILLLLAAASRDAQVHADAEVFLLERAQRQLAGFGLGRHACPGQALAMTIATAALRHVLALPQPLDPATLRWRYRASGNGRLPEFFTIAPKEQHDRRHF